MKIIISIVAFFSRLLFFLLRFISLNSIEKVINIPIGWDTLNIFAPYSFGGTPRKDFLRLYKESKIRKITTDEYHEVEYGSKRPIKEQITKKYERADFIKKMVWGSILKRASVLGAFFCS